MKTLVLASVLVWSLIAFAEEDPIVFDESFLSRFESPFFDASLSESPLVMRQIRPVNAVKGASFEQKNFAVVIELFRSFIDYAREFSYDRDKSYANIGDFKASYSHRLSERFKNVFYEIDVHRATSYAEGLKQVIEGGGAGMRLDLQSGENGNLSLSLMPLYGERRKMSSTQGAKLSASDYIGRFKAGVSYSYRAGDKAESGVRVYLQPQIVDLSQFRVYAEAYVKLKVVPGSNGGSSEFKISEINLVPKVIYWKSVDTEGLFGNDIESLFGESSLKLSSSVYAFCTLELRFRM